MKIYIYANGSADNHGCEALARSTVKIFNTNEKHSIQNATFDIKTDEKYKLDKICKLIMVGKNIKLSKTKKILSSLFRKVFKNNNLQNNWQFNDVAVSAKGNDVALSVGGDNYCYKNSADMLKYMNKKIKPFVSKTVLWGCSVEPEIIASKDGKDGLNSYDLIIARESITFEALKQNGISNNVRLIPDPAFLLDKKQIPLPKGFVENNTIGINASPLISDYENTGGATKKNYITLIKKIIENTDMQVALIPHVVVDGNDDRTILNELFDIFKDTNRVLLVKDQNCMELKSIISNCRLFIGARTHATIAAYSTFVPTLVVGYSVKAKGIAKDIFGTYENYVLPVQDLKNEDDLTKAFLWLLENEKNIKTHLESFIPAYSEKAWQAGQEVKNLFINI